MKALLALVLFFSLCPFSTASASDPAKPTCSWKLIRPVCEDPKSNSLDLRKSPSDADGVLFNFFLVHKPGRYNQIKAFDTTTEKLRKNTLSISEEVRERAIRTVTGGTPPREWTREQKAFVTRLKTVRFVAADSLDESCIALKDPGIPNAAYTAETHTITICPSLTRVHSQMIASSLAHELGHSISPCAMNKSLYKITSSADVTDVIHCLWPSPDPENDEITGQNVRIARQTLEAEFAVTNPELSSNSESAELVRCGILKPVASGDVKSPVAHRQFLKCALSQHQADYSDWLAQSQLGIETLPKKMSAAQRKIIERAKSQNPAICQSKTEETYADSFAGQVLARTAEEKDLNARAISQYAHDFSTVACRSQLEPGYDFTPTLYPSAADRVRLMIETDATMQKLGCEKDPSPLCAIEPEAFLTPAQPTTSLPPTKPQGVAQ